MRARNGASSASASAVERCHRRAHRTGRTRHRAAALSRARSRSISVCRASPRRPSRRRARRSISRTIVVERRIERPILPGSQAPSAARRPARDAPARIHDGASVAALPATPCVAHCTVRGGDAQRATPLVEDVDHVGFAELDAHRPPSRTFGVVALEVPIDAAHRDIQGHAL